MPSGATGTVTFSSNGVTLGTATISNGTATLTTSALPAGTNSISGSYSGNANYTAATSAAVSVIITVPSANLAAPTASPNSASYGTSVTLTQAVPTGATGVVTFTASGTVLGTAPIVNGVATFTTTSLAGGNNSITGTYAGNSSVSGGTSAPATVTITPAMLSLSPVTSSPAATTYNTPITLTQLLPQRHYRHGHLYLRLADTRHRAHPQRRRHPAEHLPPGRQQHGHRLLRGQQQLHICDFHLQPHRG